MADTKQPPPSIKQEEHHPQLPTSSTYVSQQNHERSELFVAKIGALDGLLKPWLSYTVVQAQDLQRTVTQSTDNALQSARSHLDELQSASSQHFRSAQGILDKSMLQYGQYEDWFFGSLKEVIHKAGNHSAISFGVFAGLGLLLMRWPRRLLFRHTIGRFQSEESLLVSSEEKVNDMRHMVDLLKNESKKLEERAGYAEGELQRGQAKLKQVAGQLQNLESSFHKREDHARGLMDSLRELPVGDALKLRAEVASMAAEAKQQRIALRRKITNIADYGISL